MSAHAEIVRPAWSLLQSKNDAPAISAICRYAIPAERVSAMTISTARIIPHCPRSAVHGKISRHIVAYRRLRLSSTAKLLESRKEPSVKIG
jgi:hypothetical protein